MPPTKKKSTKKPTKTTRKKAPPGGRKKKAKKKAPASAAAAADAEPYTSTTVAELTFDVPAAEEAAAEHARQWDKAMSAQRRRLNMGLIREAIHIPDGLVRSDPDKVAAMVLKATALELDFRSIRRIENLDAMDSLTSLNLQHNAITRIEGLESLVHLEILALNDNAISRVENLRHLRALQFLDLGNNKIGNAAEGKDEDEEEGKCGVDDAAFDPLELPPNLEMLTLEGNPVAAAPGYRARVAKACSTLLLLDGEGLDLARGSGGDGERPTTASVGLFEARFDVSGATAAQLAEADEIFDYFDRDTDGRLSYEETAAFMRVTEGDSITLSQWAGEDGICDFYGADPTRGLSRAHLRACYLDPEVAEALSSSLARDLAAVRADAAAKQQQQVENGGGTLGSFDDVLPVLDATSMEDFGIREVADAKARAQRALDEAVATVEAKTASSSEAASQRLKEELAAVAERATARKEDAMQEHDVKMAEIAKTRPPPTRKAKDRGAARGFESKFGDEEGEGEEGKAEEEEVVDAEPLPSLFAQCDAAEAKTGETVAAEEEKIEERHSRRDGGGGGGGGSSSHMAEAKVGGGAGSGGSGSGLDLGLKLPSEQVHRGKLRPRRPDRRRNEKKRVSPLSAKQQRRIKAAGGGRGKSSSRTTSSRSDDSKTLAQAFPRRRQQKGRQQVEVEGK